MRHIFFSLFPIILITNRSAIVKAPVSYHCVYSGRFNQLFDQGQQYRQLQCELLGNATNSCFFATPVTPKGAADAGEDESRNEFFEEDTLFKVTKYLDLNILDFSDKAFQRHPTEYQDTLNPTIWALQNEHKFIDSLLCTKATTLFKGRIYIAWFCPEIPISDGPWKLGGLPGLIIELYDDHDNLHFLLERFQNQCDEGLLNRFVQQFDVQSLPRYEEYIRNGKLFFSRLKDDMTTQIDGSCLDCRSSSKLELYNWENVIH